MTTWRNPLTLVELLARAKALIRRGKGQSDAVLKVGDIEIDTSALAVRRNGEMIDAHCHGVSGA